MRLLTGGPAAPGAPSLPRAPCGTEGPLSVAHRQEGRRGAQPCPERVLTAGPEGPGRPLSPGSPRGPWGGQEEMFLSGMQPPSPPVTSLCAPPAPHARSKGMPPLPQASLALHPWGCAVPPTPASFAGGGSVCAPPPTVFPIQHSPSAQEHHSHRGCQAHPRKRKRHKNGFSAPKGEKQDPEQGWASPASSPWVQQDRAHPWHHPDR